MSTIDDTAAPAAGQAATGLEHRRLRLGDTLFRGLALAASAGSVFLLGWIAYKILDLAWPSIQHFGLSFIWTEAWDPVTEQFGALTFIYGTALTSLIALVIAVPISIGIALFLTEIAPKKLAAPIATMVELLAAIPSVVLGLWGILVFGPWIAEHLEPFLQDHFGFLPIFSGSPSQAGILPAALVLTIMIVPITSAICRELFLRVPRDLTDGALALGSTRWESIRGVTLTYAAPGIAAAVLLGLGRAFGEAIAVTQVIGNFIPLKTSIFEPGDTIASRVANQYQGATTDIQIASLIYLALILLVITFLANLAAQRVVKRFEFQRTGGA